MFLHMLLQSIDPNYEKHHPSSVKITLLTTAIVLMIAVYPTVVAIVNRYIDERRFRNFRQSVNYRRRRNAISEGMPEVDALLDRLRREHVIGTPPLDRGLTPVNTRLTPVELSR